MRRRGGNEVPELRAVPWRGCAGVAHTTPLFCFIRQMLETVDHLRSHDQKVLYYQLHLVLLPGLNFA
jgi:hypothetical protein